MLLNMLRSQSRTSHYNPLFANHERRLCMVRAATSYASRLSYSPETLANAAFYIDVMVSICEPSPKEAHLMAVLAVAFAAKLLERAPAESSQDVLDRLGPAFALAEVKRTEMTLFCGLDFDFYVRTPLDFLRFFLSKGVLAQGDLDCLCLRLDDQEALLADFEAKAMEALALIRQLYHLNRCLPFIHAAVAISVARTRCGLPGWSANLEELTLVTGQAVLSFCQFFCSLLDEAGLTLPVEDGFGRGALALRVRQCPPSARSAGEEQPRGGSTGEGGKGRRRRRESRLESDGNKENSEARKGSGRKVARKKRTGLVERDGLE